MGTGHLTIHWRITRPVSSHFREASCAEVDCSQYRLGWMTVLAANDIENIRAVRGSDLNFREESDGQMVRFIFEAGQECFKGRAGGHQTSMDREPWFWKDKQILEPAQFVDEMGEHLHQFDNI